MLGEKLFFDSRLSGDTTHTCASCHDPATGWGTGEPMSHGYTSVLYFRNAPSLFNSFAKKRFMWDGRLDGADPGTLVRDMITEAHTMNADTRIVQERLKQVPEYERAFKDAFGGEPYGGAIYGAVAEFLKTIRTINAPFDRFLRGEASALTPAQIRGRDLFAGKAGCAACHAGPMLSDFKPHVIGVPDHPELLGATLGQGATHAGHGGAASDNPTAERQIAMLRHFATMGVPNFMNRREDVGYYVVSKDDRHLGAFVTPSLWDVGQTAPYMHSGVFATLAEVVEFYDRGVTAVAGRRTELKPLGMTDAEKADLVVFLGSLTGDKPAVTAPDSPDYGLRELGKN